MHARRYTAQQAGLHIESCDKIFDIQHRLTRTQGIDRLCHRLRNASFDIHQWKSFGQGEAGHRAETRYRRQQRTRVGVLRKLENFPRGRLFHRFAPVHHQRAVSHFGHHAHIMGDEQHRHPLFFLQRFYQRKDLRLDGNIQRGGRFVGNQQSWITGQRDGDHHPLTHAAGKAQRIFIQPRCSSRDPDFFQQADGFGTRGGVVHAAMPLEHFGDLHANF